MLALACHLDRLIENGVLRDFADAALVLGVSRARVTQIMDLFGVPATVQEGILVGHWVVRERRLRSSARAAATSSSERRE